MQKLKTLNKNKLIIGLIAITLFILSLLTSCNILSQTAKPEMTISDASYDDEAGEITFSATFDSNDNECTNVKFNLVVDSTVLATISYDGTELESKTYTFTGISQVITDQYTIKALADYDSNTEKEIGTYTALGWAGIKFESQTYEYDSKKHYLSVSGITSNYSVVYENNGQSEPGVYEVTATVYSKKNESLYRTYTATLTILTASGELSLEDYSVTYTGSPITIKYDSSYEYTYFDEDGNEVEELINPGTYTVHVYAPATETSEEAQTDFTLTILKATLECSIESQEIALENGKAELIISDEDFNCNDVNYNLTYFTSEGEMIESITSEGRYTALIEVEETDYYTGLMKAIGITVGEQTSSDKGVFIAQVSYFSIISNSNPFLRSTTYYLFVKVYNDTPNTINSSDILLTIGSSEAQITENKSVEIEPYSEFTYLITSSQQSYINWYTYISLSDYYDYKFLGTSSRLYTNSEEISITYNNQTDTFDFTGGKNTYDDFFAHRNYSSVDLTNVSNSQYSFTQISDETLSFEKLETYIEDNLSPTVTINDLSDTISYTTLENIISMSVYDNSDGEIEITSDDLVSLGYADFSQMTVENLGSEIKVYFYIPDSSGNKTVFYKTYTLKDEEAPTVTLTDAASNNLELDVTTPDFTTYFEVYDEYDGDILVTSDMIDLSDVDFNVKGIYYVHLNVSDSSGNTITYDYRLAIGYSKNYLSSYNVSSKLVEDGPETQNVCPSTGTVNVLVIPVSLDSSNETDELLEAINKAFNGSESEVSWQSVKSYYSESSYGNLNFNFEIYSGGWVRPGYNANYYANNQYQIFSDVLNRIDSNVDMSKYDSNSDGYIDAIWFVYNIEYYYNNSDYYWAFTADMSGENLTYDGVTMSKICFASVDFMDPDDSYNAKFNETGIVARTYIHETGHLLGLDDYYDYDYDIRTGYSHTMYEIDMMDGNMGDHNALNKLLLGWIDPTVVETSGNYTLSSTTETGEALLIAYDFESNATIYREYFILEFYTATGLNEKDSSIAFGEGEYGIRVLHVDATFNLNSKGELVSNGGTYDSYFKYDNTDDDSHNFLETLPSNEDGNIYSYSTRGGSTSYEYDVEGNVLFNETGVVFGEDVYSTFELNDGTSLFFTFEITSISSTRVDIAIDFK